MIDEKKLFLFYSFLLSCLFVFCHIKGSCRGKVSVLLSVLQCKSSPNFVDALSSFFWCEKLCISISQSSCSCSNKLTFKRHCRIEWMSITFLDCWILFSINKHWENNSINKNLTHRNVAIFFLISNFVKLKRR